MQLWLDYPPIRARSNEVYNDQNTNFYHIEGIILSITLNPERFQFGIVETSKLKRQIIGRGNLDMDFIARITPTDATRPLLITIEPNGLARLIDGYHRCARFIQLGGMFSAAWLLSNEEIKPFVLSPLQAEYIEKIRPP